MRRRRPVGKKIYTIDYLLNKQPKSLAKDSNYLTMINYLKSSSNLRGIKFNKRCYSLLNNAVIKPEHLINFYKTYRLPKHPFFPLFFMIKRDYLKSRELKKKEKLDYIDHRMEELPKNVLRYLQFVMKMESGYNRSGLHPLYTEVITPKTKKQVDMFSSYSHGDWLKFFKSYLGMLLSRYQRSSSEKIDSLSACFILDCIPDYPSELPSVSIIKNNYRRMSKMYHPDTGGDATLFLEIKWARDVLLSD